MSRRCRGPDVARSSFRAARIVVLLLAVTAALPGVVATADGASGASLWFEVTGRALAYAGLALAYGAAAWLWVMPAGLDGMAGTARRTLVLAAALHAAGLLFIAKTVADSDQMPWASTADGRLVAARLAVTLGALAMAGLAAVPRPPIALAAPVAVTFLVLAGLAPAASGNPAAAGLPGFLVDAMHLLAAATWVGGLVMFVVALGQASRGGLAVERVRAIGRRFGTLALVCVLLLVLAGFSASLLVLGRQLLREPALLVASPYGRLLLAKVGLTLLMLGLAVANRVVFLDPDGLRGWRARLAAAGPDGTTAGLRRIVTMEAVLGGSIVVLAAILATVQPPA